MTSTSAAAIAPVWRPIRPTPITPIVLPESFVDLNPSIEHLSDPRGRSLSFRRGDVPAALDLAGPLDVAALRLALAEIVRRHEALRTAFPEEAGRPVQRIGRQPPVQPVVSLTALPATHGNFAGEFIAISF